MLLDDGGDGRYDIEDNEAESGEEHDKRGGYEVSEGNLQETFVDEGGHNSLSDPSNVGG